MINSATFLSDIILFIRTTLRTNLTDPLSRSGTNFVFTSFPKENTVYPLVTIKGTNIKTTKLGMQSETSLVDISLEVQVYARNVKEADNLTQEIINDLKNAQFGTGSTTVEEIYGFNLNSCVPIEELNNNMTIHRRVMDFSYKAILT